MVLEAFLCYAGNYVLPLFLSKHEIYINRHWFPYTTENIYHSNRAPANRYNIVFDRDTNNVLFYNRKTDEIDAIFYCLRAGTY